MGRSAPTSTVRAQRARVRIITGLTGVLVATTVGHHAVAGMRWWADTLGPVESTPPTAAADADAGPARGDATALMARYRCDEAGAWRADHPGQLPPAVLLVVDRQPQHVDFRDQWEIPDRYVLAWCSQ